MPSASSTFPTSIDLERLRLKPDSSATGFVDGAWWPTSRDLAAELPALVAGLAGELGRVERMGYNIDAWDVVPRTVRIGNAVVRMAGFRFQAPATIDVIGELRTLTLLVVPPETDARAAQEILAAASRAATTDSIDALLSSAAGTDTR
jgi:hypothetical protein